MNDFVDGITFSGSGLAMAAIFVSVGFVLLLGSYSLLALLTPGSIGDVLRGNDVQAASHGAGLVAAAWLLGHSAIIVTALNSNSGYLDVGEAFMYVVGSALSFGAFGMVALAVVFVVLDLVTPGRLGHIVAAPGRPEPLAYVTAAALVGLSGVVCVAIA